MTRTFDVLIVGAGPAGLSAAAAAARDGRRTAVLDDNPHPGGQIWRRGHRCMRGSMTHSLSNLSLMQSSSSPRVRVNGFCRSPVGPCPES
jgi:phytoene dehydrogenase-like protein